MNYKHDPLSAEAQLDIIRALRKLDRRSRRAVLLRLHGFTLRAVGRELEVNAERARQVIQRGVEKMTRFLTRAPVVPALVVGPVDAALALARREAVQRELREAALVKRRAALAKALAERQRVFCNYARCPTPHKPVREGRKHYACRRAWLLVKRQERLESEGGEART